MNRLSKFTALLSLFLFVILGSAISNGFCGSWFDKYRMSAEKGKAEDQFLLGQIYLELSRRSPKSIDTSAQ